MLFIFQTILRKTLPEWENNSTGFEGFPMMTILVIWAILGPSIGLLVGCLLTAGVMHDGRTKVGTGSWMGPRGHHRHS
jgi:hypothetical protein